MSNLTGRSPVRATSTSPIVLVHGEITFGASGAVSATSAENGAWTATTGVVRDAAGRYSITLNDPCHKIMMVSTHLDNQGTIEDSTWETYTGYVNSTGVIVISHNVAGTETDPTSGTVLYICLHCKVSDL